MIERTKQTRRSQRSRLAGIFDWVGAMVTALVVLVLLFTFLFRNVGVDGDSMQPTLQHGDRLLLTALVDEYRAGDIVVVDRYTQKPLIKRVIAVAGDSVEILSDGTLLVNDREQYEPYIQGKTVRRDMLQKITVPEGCLLIMGDNRTISKDSRMAEVGCVSVKDVVGKVLVRMWPLPGIGSVYGNLEDNVEDIE